MEWLVWIGLFACSILLLIKLHLWWKGRDARKYGAPCKLGSLYGQPRSRKWPEVRDQCIERDGGCCQVCGERRRRYLRGPVFNCHLFFGHLGNFKDKFNPDVDEDAKLWRAKLKKTV